MLRKITWSNLIFLKVTNQPSTNSSFRFVLGPCTNQAIEKQYKFNSNLIKCLTNTMQMPHKYHTNALQCPMLTYLKYPSSGFRPRRG